MILIIGAGISGLALALSLQKLSIPSVIVEKDVDFNSRKQGYGLTLQQGGKAIKFLNVMDKIRNCSVSSRCHFIFNHLGDPIIFWGQKEGGAVLEKRSIYDGDRNLHISRQNLRKVLLDSIDPKWVTIKWGHALENIELISSNSDGDPLSIPLNSFKTINNEKYLKITCKTIDSTPIVFQAQLAAGCDGIYSVTRRFLYPTSNLPLTYQSHFIMLGIIDLATLPQYTCPQSETDTFLPLLDARVLQFTDGSTRIFLMPFEGEPDTFTVTTCTTLVDSDNRTETKTQKEYSKNRITKYMWQLSFPVPHLQSAQELSRKHGTELLALAKEKCKLWTPLLVSDLFQSMDPECVCGYPIYDRPPLDSIHEYKGEEGEKGLDGRVFLVGDAAHPMTPFKGQGANQALLDAVELGQVVAKYLFGKIGEEEKVDRGGGQVDGQNEKMEKEVTCLSSQSNPKPIKLKRKKKSFYLKQKSLLQSLSDQYPLQIIHEEYYTSVLKRTSSKQSTSRRQVSVLHSPDYLDPVKQSELRNFNDSNSPELRPRLERMWRDGIKCRDWKSAYSLEKYAFE